MEKKTVPNSFFFVFQMAIWKTPPFSIINFQFSIHNKSILAHPVRRYKENAHA